VTDAEIIEHLPGDLKDLAELVGVEAALLIAERYAGTYIKIPKCDGLRRDVRNKRIRADYDTGRYTLRSLALKYKLTDRQITNILSAVDETPQQVLDLFSDHAA